MKYTDFKSYDAATQTLLKKLAWNTRSDGDRAEDALQEAVLNMLEREARGEVILDPEAFLFTVARRRLWDRLRKETFLDVESIQDLDFSEEPSDSSGDPAEQFGGEEGADVLRALAAGMSVSEAADIFCEGSRFRVVAIRDNWLERELKW